MAPTSWAAFELAFESKFIPADYERSILDELKKCRQKGTATDYVKNLRRLVLTFLEMLENDKWDRIVDGLKSNLCIEVGRDPAMRFEDPAKLAVRMDLVLNGGCYFAWGGDSRSDVLPIPMEMGTLSFGATVVFFVSQRSNWRESRKTVVSYAKTRDAKLNIKTKGRVSS